MVERNGNELWGFGMKWLVLAVAMMFGGFLHSEEKFNNEDWVRNRFNLIKLNEMGISIDDRQNSLSTDTYKLLVLKKFSDCGIKEIEIPANPPMEDETTTFLIAINSKNNVSDTSAIYNVRLIIFRNIKTNYKFFTNTTIYTTGTYGTTGLGNVDAEIRKCVESLLDDFQTDYLRGNLILAPLLDKYVNPINPKPKKKKK